MSSFRVPILFLVFNRPDKTRAAFEIIRAVQPKYLYVAADGPRPDKLGELENCQQVRDIATNINWDCTVKTLFRNENLGCGKAVSDAITWFFENVEEGIILEDDCLPSHSFFSFCEILLAHYRDNDKIVSISGCNFGYSNETNYSYFFAPVMNMWGWATWKREALQIDYQLKKWSNMSDRRKSWLLLKAIYKYDKKELDTGWIKYWKNVFNKTSQKEIDTWDYQWIFHQFLKHKLSIFPTVNLVKNIGFDESATHTNIDGSLLSISAKEVSFPLKFDDKININYIFQEEYLKKRWALYKRSYFLKENIYFRVIKTKAKSFFKKLKQIQ